MHAAPSLLSAGPPKAGDIARAYDAAAATYDAELEKARWVRERLWRRMDSLFAPGTRVLDVSAGTGLDAEHLAGRGVRVVACDISPAMLERLRARAPAVEARVADFNRLDALFTEAPFDGILSTFAGLNTASDLRPFAGAAARLLTRGGILFLHMLGRWPLLDCLRLLAHGRWDRTWRILRSERRDIIVGGIAVPHYVRGPYDLHRRFFAPEFERVEICGQGVLRPLDARWGASLEKLERLCAAHAPWHSAGTFFTLEFRRR